MRALLLRDLRLAIRSGGGFGLGLAFFLLLAVLVPLGVGAESTTLGRIAPGILAGATPIALGAMCGILCERSGVVNIGIEGMMILGTFGAGYAGYQWGPWAGVAFGMFCGLLGGLLHAMATVTFGVDHIISGVAINIIAPGVTLYLA